MAFLPTECLLPSIEGIVFLGENIGLVSNTGSLPCWNSEVASHGQAFVSASLLQLAVLSVLPKHGVRGVCPSQDPKGPSPIVAKLERALAMNFTCIHCVFREHSLPGSVLISGPGPQGRIGDSVLIPILRFSFFVLATEAF